MTSVHVAFGRSLYSELFARLLCDTSHNISTSFGHSLKTFFLSQYY